MHVSFLALSTLIAISASFSHATLGCERLALRPHAIDPAEQNIDAQAPGKVEAQLAYVLPGHGYDVLSGVEVGCIGDASAEIQILQAEDDRTAEGQMGFRLILVEGELPDGAYLPRETVRAYDGFLSVMWGVGRSEKPIEAIDFTIAISAVDLAGNEGPMSEPIRVSHPRIER